MKEYQKQVTENDEAETTLRVLAIKRNIELGEMNVLKLERDDFMKYYLRARQLGGFLRDREMSRRIESGQIIRIASVITNNPEERKAYIEITNPSLFKAIKEN